MGWLMVLFQKYSDRSSKLVAFLLMSKTFGVYLCLCNRCRKGGKGDKLLLLFPLSSLMEKEHRT